MIAREGASLKRSPLPRAPSLRDGGRGTLGGEAASQREAPLPPDPSLPKSGWRSAWLLLHRWFRLSVGVSPISLVVVTAADRAAATFAGGETLGGEAASLREAPLPPDPSLPKSGWRSAGLLLHGWFRLSVGVSPVSLVVITGDGTPPPASRAPPLSGEAF